MVLMQLSGLRVPVRTHHFKQLGYEMLWWRHWWRQSLWKSLLKERIYLIWV